MKKFLTISLLLCMWASCRASAEGDVSLELISHNIVESLRKNDVREFAWNCSQEGIIIAQRAVLWNRMNGKSEKSEKDFDKTLDVQIIGSDKMVWMDEQVHFDLDRLADNGDFKKMFREFHEIIKDSYGTRVSTNMWDAWHSRLLGPATSCKLASNYFLYIFYIREGSGWKVWRLEAAIH
jgi:hypothetical protein